MTRDPLAMLSAMTSNETARRAAEKAANRAAMPECTKAVDMVRALYPDAKVLWMSEGGKEVGKRPKDDWVMSADAYIGLHQHYHYNGLLGETKRKGRR